MAFRGACDDLTRQGIPNANCIVAGPRGNSRAIRREGNGTDTTGVAVKCACVCWPSLFTPQRTDRCLEIWICNAPQLSCLQVKKTVRIRRCGGYFLILGYGKQQRIDWHLKQSPIILYWKPARIVSTPLALTLHSQEEATYFNQRRNS